jgi:Cu+-exporting ATPase
VKQRAGVDEQRHELFDRWRGAAIHGSGAPDIRMCRSVLPFAYGHTIRLLGRRGLFLRDAEVVERMARIDTVILDKTGTLTAREAHEVEWNGGTLNEHERSLVRSLARNSTHPLSALLAERMKEEVLDAIEVEETVGQGIAGIVSRSTVRLGSAVFCGGEEARRGHGDPHVHVTINGFHRGYFAIRKRTREGITDAVRHLRERSRVGLLTGDAHVDPVLAAAFAGTDVRTNCSPTDKSQAVREAQAKGQRVLMVGDGLNDAGALAQSDVGITVTETSAALTPASDAIMDANAVAHLPHFLRITRRARRIVLGSLCISLCYNVVGVSFAVSGQLTPLIAGPSCL